jgi:pterin-4a-carbinolamine dehydratase
MTTTTTTTASVATEAGVVDDGGRRPRPRRTAAASSHRRDDPTASRPTTRCDPYGLGGGSLSSAECEAWMPTLGGGWRLLPPPPREESAEGGDGFDVDVDVVHGNGDLDGAGGDDPEFLQREFYHHTFVDAARFVSHVSSLATNVGHFPHLSVERVLATTDDVMMRDHDDDAHEDGDDATTTADDDATTTFDDPATSTSSSKGGRGRTTKKAARHRGWIVRSTVRCSTHRPLLLGRGRRSDDDGDDDDDDRRRRRSRRPPRGGLTYHDFHLALCIDVEAGRDEVHRLLLLPPSSRPRSDS